MNARNNYFKIGLFVLAALALLVAGILAFGAKAYFTPKTRFETSVEGDVEGLSVGSGVHLRGVPIGKVTRITFCWHTYPESKSRNLLVEFEIDGDLMPWPPTGVKTVVAQAVQSGLRAVVKGQGITGTSLLSLENLDPPPPVSPLDYRPRYYYIPSAPGQFTRMLDALENSLDALQKVDFASISQGITNALLGVRQLATKVDRIDLDAIATNANALVVEARSTVSELRRTIDDMNLEQVGTNANVLVSGLSDTNRRLQSFLAKISAAPLADTLVDLQEILQSLNAALVELRRYPAGFFLGEPPIPVKGVQHGGPSR